MAAKAATRQCRIFQWVEQQDSEFADAIRQLCLEGALSPGGHVAGVTFLYPEDKAYRAEITAKAYSDAADEAVRMVESLIIPDILTSGADFNRSGHPIGNRLGVRLDVEKADAKSVKLAGGVEIKLASDFRPLAGREGKIAVWVVTKGRLPLTGAAYQPPKSRGTRGGARHGGAGDAAAPMLLPLNERQNRAAAVESEFDVQMARDKCASSNPYLAKVASLLNFLRLDHSDLLRVVLPILDYDPVVSYYLLFEPYKTKGAHLISDAILFGPGGWNGAQIWEGNAVDAFEGFLRMAQEGTMDHGAVAAAVDKERQRLLGMNPQSALREARGAYTRLADQNTIGGQGPVLPEGTRAALAGGKKLWQDEFRFIIHEALQSVRQGPYSSASFGSVVRDLRFKYCGDDYENELTLLNPAITAGVAPRTELLLMVRFINSTDFLYTPPPPEAIGDAWGSMAPDDPEVYNRASRARTALRTTTGMVKAGTISDRALAEVRAYYQGHGQLPPEVAALSTK
jgi:hypothetical protein